ncbi:MAG: hypothetical protein Q7T82_12085, partial [Armatimonadota bacterium]|nr:hypothetical protein [Armatimonadota bacterium]
RYVTALMNVDGRPEWYGKYNDGPSALQGIGNVDGSGKLSIGGAGYSDGFRCMDPATGAVKWTYALPSPASDGATITADVDGDGIEEFLFTRGQTLYALNGKDGQPNLVWQIALPALPGPLAYADADGDGSPEIIFGGGDGNIYLIGEAKAGPEK